MTKRIWKRLGAITGALMLGALFTVIAPAPAFADPVDVTLTLNSAAPEYGQGWGVTGVIAAGYTCAGFGCDAHLVVTVDGISKDLGDNRVYQNNLYFGDSDFLPQKDFGAGDHTASVQLKNGSNIYAQSTNPVHFTVTKAAIATTTTIVADPNNAQNAIITSQLSGVYIQQLPNCQCEGQNGYLMPSGTWNLSVTDSNGKTVLSKQLDQAANGLPSFVNYWSTVPAGETFTAESTFTPSGSTKSNFAFTSTKFSWTSKKSAGELGPGSPSSTPKPVTVQPASFAPPAIVYWAGLLVALILIALDVILLVGNVRARKVLPTPKEATQ